jgi:hypothetical protein
MAGTIFSQAARAQSNQSVYTDSLQSGWENWSWAATVLNNLSPTHAGTASIKITATAYQALYLHHAAFDSSPYASLSFWIHGGTSGGQRMQVQALLSGAAQTAVPIGPLAANAWQQVTIPLSSLGAANKPNLDGFWIQDTTGTTQPAYFVDDIQVVAVPPPSSVNLSVDAIATLRSVDSRMFGVNAAVWDSAFNTFATISLLQDNGNQILRFPGGSLSDEYHWATNTTLNNTWTWATSFDAFANVARSTGAQAFITVNYGTGTPQEAADWVRYSNITKAYGFRYWEIGNENYGTWETDNHPRRNDPYTYATLARDYITQMKAVDPSIKIGVVVAKGEDAYANFTDHPATNLRTGSTHNGWTAVMLATLRSLGVTPDFVVYHKYDQGPGGESDAGLLTSAGSWAGDVADLRQQLNDYLGAASSSVEIICTENNSVYTSPGKQTTSLVNGLFLADSIGQALQTELKGLVWWDLRNGQDTANNNSASLYGWRQYGDYGIVSGSNDRYPTYYVSKLLKYFARGGDSVVRATTDYMLVQPYAVKRQDGSLCLLVINKSGTTAFSANISVAGFTVNPTAPVYSYGIPQDNAAQTSPGTAAADVQTALISNAGASFTYTFPPYSATILALNGSAGPPPPPVPSAPSGLSASAVSTTQINLAWTDNSSNEDGFKVERSTNGTSWTQVGTVAANGKTFSSTGLAKNTLYYFRVRAYNASGNSAYSNTASARTLKR